MSKEDFCTFREQECTQAPKPFCEEGRSVWSHLTGLTCNDPQNPNYIETGGRPGSYLLYNSTPERRAELQSTRETIGHSCRLCRKKLEDLLGMWEEIDL